MLGLAEALKEIARLGFDGLELPLKCILHLAKDRQVISSKYYLMILMLAYSRWIQDPVGPAQAAGDHDGCILGPLPRLDRPPASQRRATRPPWWRTTSRCSRWWPPRRSTPPSSTVTRSGKVHTEIKSQNLTDRSQNDVQDYFTAEMAEEFFRRALAWQEGNCFNVYHETQRKRLLHSLWVARSFMLKVSQMKVSDPASS